MPRITQFSIGQEWRCGPEAGSGGLTFVIVGHGPRPNQKLCRLEYDNPRGSIHGSIQSYTHAHLKRYATLLPLEKS